MGSLRHRHRVKGDRAHVESHMHVDSHVHVDSHMHIRKSHYYISRWSTACLSPRLFSFIYFIGSPGLPPRRPAPPGR